MSFASNAIPVDQIIVSEYCRSWKTANLAFGEWTQKDSRLNFLPYEDYTRDHIALMKKNVMPLLTYPPLPGTNTIIIGHDDPFEAVTGIYPEPQGIAYILQPDGGKSFKIIDSVLPSEWATLWARQPLWSLIIWLERCSGSNTRLMRCQHSRHRRAG